MLSPTLLIAPLLIAGLACFARAGTGQPANDDELTLRRLEAAEVTAILSGDFAAMEHDWAAHFVVNAPNNQVRDRAAVLDAFKTGQLKYAAFTRTIERVMFLGDVAIVMGGETVTPAAGPMAGKSIDRRYTDVWQKLDGRWQLVARHANAAAVMAK